MTLSNTTTFKSTVGEIIEDAYARCQVLGVDESLDAENLKKALRIFNRMLKAWQNNEINIWKISTGILFLQKDQSDYQIYASSSDHHAEAYRHTTISADEAIGQTTISVTSSANMTVGDYIGIEDDDGELEWSTITNIPGSTSVIINDPLTVAASENNQVYSYTTKLDNPFNIYSANRINSSDIETPLMSESYQDFFQIPNKTTDSTLTAYNYNRRLDYARIRVWPTPSDVSYHMTFTFSKRIQDAGSVTNTIDYPQEWEEAIVLNLAVRIAGMFGKEEGDNFADLKSQASDALTNAMLFDDEEGSIFLEIDERYS